jgi:hypothetical protein
MFVPLPSAFRTKFPHPHRVLFLNLEYDPAILAQATFSSYADEMAVPILDEVTSDIDKKRDAPVAS